jgi:hypothetical protein
VHDEYEAASCDRNLIQDLLKELELQRKELTRPIDELKSKVTNQFREPAQKLEALKANIEREMMAFKKRLDEERAREQREFERAAQAEAKAERERLATLAAEKQEQGQVHIAEAIIEEAAKVTAAVVVLAPVKIPSQEVITKKNWKFKIVNAQQVPLQFCIPNEKLLQSLATSMKEAASVPGVEFYFEETISARRK